MQEDSRAGHEETHRLLRNLQGETVVEHPSFTLISSDMAECFVQNYRKASSDVNPTVSQRLDAVQSFYGGSTKDFKEEEPFIVCPSPVQYLNLLKCIWLLDQVKSDQGLRSYCADPFNAAYARSLDRKVTTEAQRFLQGEHPLACVGDDQLFEARHSSLQCGFLEANRGPDAWTA